MKNALILILSLLTLQSCLSSFEEKEFNSTPELQSYVDQFFIEANDRGLYYPKGNLIVAFKKNLNKSEQAWGISTKKLGQRIIYIDYDFFYEQKQYRDRIEALIFHEMGHAILNRKHCESQSLMNPSWGFSCYENLPKIRKIFVDELFK